MPQTKLNDAERERIVLDHRRSATLAMVYGVHVSTIARIRKLAVDNIAGRRG